MYKSIALFVFVVFLNFDSLACINGESKELKDGTLLYEDNTLIIPTGHSLNNDEELTKAIKRLDSLYRKTNDIEYLSDIGVVYIYLKQYEKAIKLYLDIEKRFPNRYSTASNIGTAYELNGQNEEALKWIQKALKIDPNSHQGSEWIHLNILRAKIRGEGFYNSKFLLNVDFGNNAEPKAGLDSIEQENLLDDLYYQLNERITFVKPKDKIVARLMFDFGNILFLQKRYFDANVAYIGAESYGFHGNLLKNRRAKCQELSPSEPNYLYDFKSLNQQSLRYYVFLGLIVIGIMILIIRPILRAKYRR